MATPLRFDNAEVFYDLSVAPATRGCFRVSCGIEILEFENVRRELSQVRFSLNGTDLAARYAWSGDTLLLDFAGQTYSLRNALLDPPQSAAGSGSDGRVAAPMNGRVAAIEVSTGGAVAAGQTLLVLEAMKMEHPIVAPVAGTVAEIGVAVGEQIAPGRLLMRIEPAAAEK
jgi:geranyl-CoA carboxylase alpha subunit